MSAFDDNLMSQMANWYYVLADLMQASHPGIVDSRTDLLEITDS